MTCAFSLTAKQRGNQTALAHCRSCVLFFHNRSLKDDSRESRFGRDNRDVQRSSRDSRDSRLKDPWEKDEPTRGRDRDWRDRSPLRDRDRDRRRERSRFSPTEPDRGKIRSGLVVAEREKESGDARFVPFTQWLHIVLLFADSFGREKSARNSGVDGNRSL